MKIRANIYSTVQILQGVSKPVTTELHWRLHGRPVQRNHNRKILIGNLAFFCFFLKQQVLKFRLVLPDVREAMAVLDSGFHAMDISGFQILDSSFPQWNKH